MPIIGAIKNGVKTKVAAKLPNLFPASRTTYDNTSSGLTANRVQGAIDEIRNKLGIFSQTITTADMTCDNGSIIDGNVIIKNGVAYISITVQRTDNSQSTTITVSGLNCVSYTSFIQSYNGWGANEQTYTPCNFMGNSIIFTGGIGTFNKINVAVPLS